MAQILYYVILSVIFQVFNCDSARILAVFPAPSISHQVPFRPYAQELARRGYEVVIITSVPAFPKDNSPANLTEIDVHEAGYKAKSNRLAENAKGKRDDIFSQMKIFFRLFSSIFEAVIRTSPVQELVKSHQHFDLLILAANYRPALVFSHIFKAPVILFNIMGMFDMLSEYTGSAMHPILYPSFFHQKQKNLTVQEKTIELYKHHMFESTIKDLESEEDEMLRRNFGADIPPLRDLKKNIALMLLAEHRIWDNNRPVPPGVIYVGGIHPMASVEELPIDIKTFLDFSTTGVVYMSLGSNVKPSLLPRQKIQLFLDAFSKLPYDVLLKWDSEEFVGAPENVKIFTWLPQAALLRHPNVKLFITQGGIQSTEDAIAAGVPLIGMPLLGDQWYNVEQYIHHQIGLKLDIESLTEDMISTAITTVIGDDSYRRNIAALRQLVRDQPQTALDRAIWWTEHVIQHKGARHLRAPAALIPTWDYFELDLVIIISGLIIFTVSVLFYIVFTCLQYLKLYRINVKKH